MFCINICLESVNFLLLVHVRCVKTPYTTSLAVTFFSLSTSTVLTSQQQSQSPSSPSAMHTAASERLGSLCYFLRFQLKDFSNWVITIAQQFYVFCIKLFSFEPLNDFWGQIIQSKCFWVYPFLAIVSIMVFSSCSHLVVFSPPCTQYNIQINSLHTTAPSAISQVTSAWGEAPKAAHKSHTQSLNYSALAT